jgi:hypothetical protein
VGPLGTFHRHLSSKAPVMQLPSDPSRSSRVRTLGHCRTQRLNTTCSSVLGGRAWAAAGLLLGPGGLREALLANSGSQPLVSEVQRHWGTSGEESGPREEGGMRTIGVEQELALFLKQASG